MIPHFTEDVIVYSIPEWPDDPEYHGHDGLRRLFRRLAENFDDFGLELRNLRDEGEGTDHDAGRPTVCSPPGLWAFHVGGPVRAA